jgi:hypothetical protein
MRHDWGILSWSAIADAAFAVALLLALSACTPTTVQTVCPTVTEYSQAFRDRLADELQSLPPGSATLEFVADAITLRDRLRAREP